MSRPTVYSPFLDIGLLVGLLLAYIAGNGSVPLFDRDEPRYAVTSRAMLESGDYVVPRFLGEVRTAKPPAVYWLQASAMTVVGVNEFAVRLPGALGCVVAVAVVRYGGAGVVGRRRARWAAFILGTSTLTLGVAKVGVTDGPLLACGATMFVGLLHAQRGSRWAWLLVWLAVGVGGLLKGPVLLGVLVATLVAWGILGWMARRNKETDAEAEASDSAAGDSDQDPKRPLRRRGLLRTLHPFAGLAIALLVCLPWLILIQVREPTFLSTTLWHDLFTRSTRGLEGHGQPPGFHTLLLPATFFPWSVLLPGALIIGWRRWRWPWMRLAIAAVVGPLVMFELVATKLPHYLLPTFPALSLIVADWIVRASAGRLELDRRGLTLGGVIFGVVFVGIGIAGMILTSPRLAWPVAVLAVAAAVVAFRSWRRADLPAGVATVGVAWAFLVAATFTTWLGRFPPLTLSPRIAAEASAVDVERAAMVDYKEPSLAWSAGQLGIEVYEAGPSAFAADGPEWIITTRKALERLPAAVAEPWRVVAAESGRNYNDGLVEQEVLIVRRQSVTSQSGTR